MTRFLMADDISKILKGAKVYKWSSSPATTPEQSVDRDAFYGHTIDEAVRAVREKKAAVSNPVRQAISSAHSLIKGSLS
jgi:hypothetical protein